MPADHARVPSWPPGAPTTLRQAREAVHRAALRMVADGLVVGSAGNVSVRAPGRAPRIVVSPTGVPYEYLHAADYPVVDVTSGSSRGALRATSELPLHLGIMQRMPDVQAVVHTHSRCATAFAVARQDIPFVCNENLGAAARRILVSRPYAVPSTADLARIAVDTFARASGSRAILLANHGLVAVGATVEAAYLVAAQVEWVAAVCLGARQLGGEHVLNRTQQDAMATAYGVGLARE